MESWFSELIQQGGPAALRILSLAAPTLAVSIFHAIWPRRWAVWAGGIAVALFLVTGVVGLVQGRDLTDKSVEAWTHDPKVAPAEIVEMHERGYAEARVPLEIAGVLAGACAIPLLVGELRRRRRSAVIAA